MNAIWAIASKDIRLLLRDRLGFFFSFIFPLIIAVFFGTVFSSGGGGPQRISVAAVDLDKTPGSAAFIKSLIDGDDLSVTQIPTRDAAAASVRAGDISAYIVIPPGFGAARESPFSGSAMTLDVGIDPARKATSGMLQGILTKYGFMQLQSAFQNPEQMRTMARSSLGRIRDQGNLDPDRMRLFDTFFGNLDTMLATIPPADNAGGKGTDESSAGLAGWQPITITTTAVAAEGRGPPNIFAVTFPQGIIWGVMGCALGFGVALVLERTRGTLIRLRVAPIAPWQILAGKALACFISTAGVSTVLLLIAFFGFHVRPTSIPLLVVAVVSTCLCFVGIMNLLAVFSKTEASGNGLGWGVLLVLSMIGGGMIPLEFMPGWMHAVSSISPIKWSILALEGGLWRGFTPGQMLLPCGVLIAIGVGGFLAGMRAFGAAERS